MTPVKNLLSCLSGFAQIRPDIGLNSVIIFIYIAHEFMDKNRKDGIPMKEIQEFVGESPATTSRTIRVLTKLTAKKSVGLDLVETFEDPFDARHKRCCLNIKGCELYERLKKSLHD